MELSTKLWISIGFLLVLNVFLAYANTTKNEEISQLNNQQKQNKSSFITKEPVRVDSILIAKKSSPFHLVAIFPKLYCSICIDMEVPQLQKLARRYPNVITILDIGMEYNLFSIIGEEVDVEKTSDIREVINWNRSEVDVPIILIIDRSGLVQLQYINNYLHPERTSHFYEHVNSLFASVYDQ